MTAGQLAPIGIRELGEQTLKLFFVGAVAYKEHDVITDQRAQLLTRVRTQRPREVIRRRQYQRLWPRKAATEPHQSAALGIRIRDRLPAIQHIYRLAKLARRRLKQLVRTGGEDQRKMGDRAFVSGDGLDLRIHQLAQRSDERRPPRSLLLERAAFFNRSEHRFSLLTDRELRLLPP